MERVGLMYAGEPLSEAEEGRRGLWVMVALMFLSAVLLAVALAQAMHRPERRVGGQRLFRLASVLKD